MVSSEKSANSLINRKPANANSIGNGTLSCPHSRLLAIWLNELRSLWGDVPWTSYKSYASISNKYAHIFDCSAKLRVYADYFKKSMMSWPRSHTSDVPQLFLTLSVYFSIEEEDQSAREPLEAPMRITSSSAAQLPPDSMVHVNIQREAIIENRNTTN